MRRSIISSRGLVAAMEEEELINAEAEVIETTDIVEEGGLESTETAIAETDAVETEVVEQTEQIEEAAETSEALESIALALEASAKNGGLDRYSAAAVGIAVECLYERVGMGSSSMPSLESFGGTSTRVGATVAMESDIKAKIQHIWKAIVEAVKKAIAWVKQFFAKIFVAHKRMGEKAKKVVEKAKSTIGKAANNTFDSEQLAETLQVDGAVPKDLNLVMSHYVASVRDAYSVCKGMSKSIEAEGAAIGKGTFDDYTIDAYGGYDVSDFYDVSSKIKGGNVPEGMVLMERKAEHIVGGVTLSLLVNKTALKGEKAAEMAGRVKVKFGKSVLYKKMMSIRFDVLTPSECGQVATSVVALSNEIESNKATVEQVEKAMDGFTADIMRAAKVIESNSDGKQKAVGIARAIASGMSAKSGAISSSVAQSIRVGNAALEVAIKSLKEYSETVAPKAVAKAKK